MFHPSVAYSIYKKRKIKCLRSFYRATESTVGLTRIGLAGLAVMGQVRFATVSFCSAGDDLPSSSTRRDPCPRLLLPWQNLALNIAEKGFPISVYNRSANKVDDTVERAKAEGDLPLVGFKNVKEFVESIKRPR